MEKFNSMNELNVKTTVTVQTPSKLVKIVSSAECVKEIAQLAADTTKSVADVSTVLELVVI